MIFSYQFFEFAPEFGAKYNKKKKLNNKLITTSNKTLVNINLSLFHHIQLILLRTISSNSKMCIYPPPFSRRDPSIIAKQNRRGGGGREGRKGNLVQRKVVRREKSRWKI